MHPAAKVADKDDEDGIADLQREQRGRVRPETLSLLTHRGDLTVPAPGKAERQEAAHCQPCPDSLTVGPRCAISILPYVRIPSQSQPPGPDKGKYLETVKSS